MSKKCYLLATEKNNMKNSAKFYVVREPYLNDTYSTTFTQYSSFPEVYIKFDEIVEYPIYNNPSSTIQLYKLYDETLSNEKYFNNIYFPLNNEPTATYSGYLYYPVGNATEVFNRLHYYNGGTNKHRLVECRVLVNGNPNPQPTYFSISDVCTFSKIYVDLDSLTSKRRVDFKDDAKPSQTYNSIVYGYAYNFYDENFNLLKYDNNSPVLSSYTLINENSPLNTQISIIRAGSTNGASNLNSNINKYYSKDRLQIITNDITYINVDDDNQPVKYMDNVLYKIIEENGVKYVQSEIPATGGYGTVQFLVKQSEKSIGDGIRRKCRLIANNIKRSLIVNPLPYEYQEVEWIEGDSTNFYLNTGVKMDLTKDTYIEGKFLIPSSGSRRYVFGSYSAEYNVNIEVIAADLLRLYMGTDKGLSSSTVSFNTPEICTFSYDPSTNTATTTYGQRVVSTVYDYKGVHSNNVSLFTDTRKSGSPFAGIRVYYYKHYENGLLKCNLIPCYRKSDNKIGMYDLVSNTFKINELSGTFTKGNNVTS